MLCWLCPFAARYFVAVGEQRVSRKMRRSLSLHDFSNSLAHALSFSLSLAEWVELHASLASKAVQRRLLSELSLSTSRRRSAALVLSHFVFVSS